MSDRVHLIVDLAGERFTAQASARSLRSIEALGLRHRVVIGDDDQAVLAWIDATFRGSWSSDAFAARCMVVENGQMPVGVATIDAQHRRSCRLPDRARQPDAGLLDFVGVEQAWRHRGVGAALLTLALGALAQQGYRYALIPCVGSSSVGWYERHAGARVVETVAHAGQRVTPVRASILVSGDGSNLQAVLDRVQDGRLALQIGSVISNNERAYAVERARHAGVADVRVLPWRRAEQSRSAYDAQLLAMVRAGEPELILLLGWMHLLDAAFVSSFPQTLNLHPAFLPLDPAHDCVVFPDGRQQRAFRGAHAVADALAAGSRWIGATVHRLQAEMDRGAVMAREPLALPEGADEAMAMQALRPVEHRVVETAVRRWLDER